MHGIEKFKEISEVADGVIFVRNELQWELPSEKLMIAQKWAIQQCNSLAKPMFLQSQILESMVTKDQPTRQELTEITSATLDGADAFIMSHETSMSQYGVEAVTSLAKGIAEAESVYDHE